jgi:signal transduction histidine kinase
MRSSPSVLARIFLLGVACCAAVSGALAGVPARPAVPLTEAESAWLQKHPVLKVGADPEWPPFSFFNKDGAHDGMDADLLRHLGERLGVQFEVPQMGNWEDTLALADAGRVDLLCGMAATPDREKNYLFTQPYMRAPVAVIMRSDAPFYTGLRNLSGRTVAAPAAYVTTSTIEEQYPAIHLKKTKTAAEALQAVSRGQADAMVENLVSASSLMRSEGLTNLKIVGLAEFDFELRLAVPKSEPVLHDILQKGLASISDEELARMRDKWVPVDIAGAINWSVVKRFALWVFGTAAVVLGVVVLKNRRLAGELKARRRAERESHELHEEKDHLMAMFAHDLSNPLQTIILACDHLQKGPEKGLDEEDSLEVVRQTVDRMSRLVRNVLKVNSLEAGPPSFELKKVEVAPSVADVVASFQPQAKAKSIALYFRPGDGEILGNADALAQITDNLVGNAIKFTPAGGRVDVAVERHSGSVEFSIHDTGPGIREDERPKLFEKFTRLSAQPTAGESSHGLGLAIVKRLVEIMGGTIAVESQPGTGATFRLLFPEAA